LCGIAFILNYGKEEIPKSFYKKLFTNLSQRGTDASGFYWEREEKDGTLRMLTKAPIESKLLWEKIHESESKKYNDCHKFRLNGKEKLVIFHCRAKTRGSELDNYNNGPIMSENFVLAHNGVITSSKLDNYKYKGEVDSEEILARIETHGVKNGLPFLHGSMASIIRSLKEPTIYLFRNTNPIELCYMIDKKWLIGCSKLDLVPIPEEVKQISGYLFTPKVSFYCLKSDILYKISTNKAGIIEDGEIKEVFGSSCSVNYEQYGQQWGKWKEGKLIEYGD
jgi:glucosamine 6-phosphate synthetase-like amidotransferase/phosphosugar isomerase protein